MKRAVDFPVTGKLHINQVMAMRSLIRIWTVMTGTAFHSGIPWAAHLYLVLPGKINLFGWCFFPVIFVKHASFILFLIWETHFI